MRGQSRLAVTTMNEMVQGIPPGWLRDNAAIADGFTAMPLEVLVRFGRWEEVLAAPEPPDYLPLARCLRHGARGIAYAAQGNVESAQAEQQSFLRAKSALPPDRIFGNNKAADLLAVAEHLLAGEILYRTGKVDAGITALREAVAREDQLRYSEPPDWIHPVRHALGADTAPRKACPRSGEGLSRRSGEIARKRLVLVWARSQPPTPRQRSGGDGMGVTLPKGMRRCGCDHFVLLLLPAGTLTMIST